MLVAMPNIVFVRGIPTAFEQDSYFDVNKRNLIVFDEQMIDAKNQYEETVKRPFRYLLIDL